MADEDFDSDTSDEDYVPIEGEAVSEEEDSGEDEDFVVDTEGACGEQHTDRNAKRQKSAAKKGKTKKIIARKRKGGIKLDDDPLVAAGSTSDLATSDNHDVDHTDLGTDLAVQVALEQAAKIQEQQKKKEDSLWADFMKDVSGGAKATPAITSTSTASKSVSHTPPGSVSSRSSSTSSISSSAPPAKVTITKEFDFAGEVVKVTQEVSADSKEAKTVLRPPCPVTTVTPTSSSPSTSAASVKRPGGGLSSVLGMIGKKQKISTLEKSKLDWESFKEAEGIDDELKLHNRGKSGYLERQAFLSRADYRQYELERDLRMKAGPKQ